MIHPTRTNLLLLKGKALSIAGSVTILKARRQALIREFLGAVRPFFNSRDEIRANYRRALEELHLSLALEGQDFLESLAAASDRQGGVEIEAHNLMGIKCRELSVHDFMVRSPEERYYDYSGTTPHLEESIYLFEKIVQDMLAVATFETRLKRLGEEILRVTRRIRVLEERVLPALEDRVKTISRFLEERERESYFRLKRFKELHTGPQDPGTFSRR